MKKLLSLLLAAVMVFGLLALTAHADVDKPAECDAASAGVKVASTANSETYTFETLSPAVVSWACAMLPGNKTITMLKDLDISDGATATSVSCLVVPTSIADWYGGKGAASQNVIFDLGGHTLTYTGDHNLFYVQRYGCTIKNGTILYTCVGNTRAVMALGTTTGNTATSSGTLWEPKITFDNVKAFNLTEKGGAVINSNEYAPRFTIKNCVFWSQNGSALRMNKTDQSGISGGAAYAGEYDAQVAVMKSVIGSGKQYPIYSRDEVKLNLGDAVLVSSKEAMTDDQTELDITVASGNDEPTVVEGWSLEEAGNAMTGTAYVYGNDPYDQPLPFTDVAESDWFYSFVKQMYTKKVISGMTATTFVPNGTLTYGQALKLLVAAIDTDVGNASSGHWASNYLAKAKEKGWVDGDVQLDASISRLSFCQIAAKAKELTEQPASNPFKDTSDTAVLALVNKGVINGMSENTFAPDNTLTRAQIAKIIALLKAL